VIGVVAQVSASPGGLPNHEVDEAQLIETGIVGDNWRHPAFHGTRKRAILLITSEGIDELVAQGFPVCHGALGENITTRGLDRRGLRIGQRFRIGQAVIQLTEVRVPCGALSIYGAGIQAAIYDSRVQAGDPASPLWGMSGFYASVAEPGILRPGDLIALITREHWPNVARLSGKNDHSIRGRGQRDSSNRRQAYRQSRILSVRG
jgi:MOSC domain-containing protein YiiM